MELIGRVTPESTLIVVALEQESRHFVVEHPVLVTGVGKVRAGVAVARVLASGVVPARVVNVGTAGGLTDGLTGTVEVGRVLQHDYDDEALHAITGRHDGPPLDLDTPAGAGAGPTLATGDLFVAGGERRERAARIADLVDMEGYAVARIGAAFDIPVTLLKQVSDRADESAYRTWSAAVDIGAQELARELVRLDWASSAAPPAAS